MNNYPLKVLSLFILAAPVINSVYLRENLFGLQGAKPLNLIMAAFLLAIVLFHGQSVKMPKRNARFLLAMFLLFTVCVLRSLKYLDVFGEYVTEGAKGDTVSYLLSEYVKPLVWFMPIVFLARFLRTEKELVRIAGVVQAALLLFSVILLASYALHIRHFAEDLQEVDDYFLLNYGIHRNGIGNFFIIGFPIALSRLATDRSRLTIASLVVILSAVAVTLSRTTYLCAVIAILLQAFFWRKQSLFLRKHIIPILVVAGLAASVAVTQTILERVQSGVESRDVNEISSSRVEGIWIPLLEEYVRDPYRLAFGNGRYAIVSTKPAQDGSIVEDIQHAHNMYLDIVLDAGLVGLAFFLSFYYYVLRSLFRFLRMEQYANLRPQIEAFIVSIACYLVAGITGRTFFPKQENAWIWIVLGCSIAVYNLRYVFVEAKEEAA